MASTQAGTLTSGDPVLFAYDGSELAAFAIEQSARQLAAGREALVLCVWQPADVSLIVIGSHRRSGLTGHLLGSVAAAVVAHSPSSVLVVHHGSGDDVLVPEAAEGER